jgi:hypothetical protein
MMALLRVGGVPKILESAMKQIVFAKETIYPVKTALTRMAFHIPATEAFAKCQLAIPLTIRLDVRLIFVTQQQILALLAPIWNGIQPVTPSRLAQKTYSALLKMYAVPLLAPFHP